MNGAARVKEKDRPDPRTPVPRPRALYVAHSDLGIDQIAATIGPEPFAPHAHDDYLIGVTTAGSEAFIQSGRADISRAGCLRLINPGEVHSGGANDDLWSYEAIYLPPVTLAQFAGGREPDFAAAVVDDPAAVATMLRLFGLLRTSTDPHERETALAAALAPIIARHGGGGGRSPLVEQRAVALARDYVHGHLADRITLADLGAAVGLSRFHLLRQFKAATGQTPWQYQTQLRIELARAQLRAGEPVARVAQNCGFVDQSHFTRIFRRVVGVTPGTFAAAVAAARRSVVPA